MAVRTAACVVIIEDDVDILYILSTILDESGYQVVALSYANLIRYLDMGPRPDLFLIDVMLPGKDGIELARDLRAAGFDQTPMIAISASASMVAKALDSGLFQDFLPKPLDLSSLLECVAAHLPDSPLN